MTLAEVIRYLESRKRVLEVQERKQASFDYILADLIGRSVGRLYSKQCKFPNIEDVYPTLFSAEEIQATKAEKNRQRFMAGLQQFAQFHNTEEVAKDK